MLVSFFVWRFFLRRRGTTSNNYNYFGLRTTMDLIISQLMWVTGTFNRVLSQWAATKYINAFSVRKEMFNKKRPRWWLASGVWMFTFWGMHHHDICPLSSRNIDSHIFVFFFMKLFPNLWHLNCILCMCEFVKLTAANQ